MTDAELREALARIGIREQDLRAVMLLPLVEVAWSDGHVQEAERAIILKTARTYGLVSGPGAEAVAGWLEVRPSPEIQQLARRVLVGLSTRFEGPAADLGALVIESVEAHCEAVALAAGGLFGVVFTVGEAEKQALREIRQALRPGSPIEP